MATDLASARAQLRQAGSEGVSVYDHLTSLLTRIIKEKPKDPLKEFESLSVTIKQQRLRQKAKQEAQEAAQAAEGDEAAAKAPPKATVAVNGAGVVGIDVPSAPLVSDPALKAALLQRLEQTQQLFRKPKPVNEEGEEEEHEEVDMNPESPDIVEQAYLYKEAGISLKESELYRLSVSIQHLCDTEEGMEGARFWGKVLGVERDYYVLESKVSDAGYPEDDEEEEAEAAAHAADRPEPEEGDEDEEEEEPPASRTEPWGIGANEHVYYAATSPDGPFKRLPKVTPEQILAARGSRRFFTGRLDAPVHGFPRFPWGEASYLRAQIARITASTYLAPRGMLLPDEEEPLLTLENEEWTGVRASAMLDPSAWLHARPKLLGEGRVEAFVDEDAEEEDDDDELSPLELEARQLAREAREKPVRILQPITQDRIVGKNGRVLRRQLWKLQLSNHADTGARPRAPPPPGVDPDDLPPDQAESHVVAMARSLLWPGAVSLVRHKQTAHVYVGWGLKAQRAAYRPAGPAPPQSEYTPPTQPNKRGVVVNPIAEQVDPLPPPPDQDPRSEEEKQQEAEEEAARLARLEAEQSEPAPELEDEEEEEPEEEDEDED